MKILVVFAAMMLLASAAAAPSCKSITDKKVRLACYDKADPGPNVSDSTAAQPVPQSSESRDKDNRGKYVDKIGAEDALMNARLKNICRGC